MTCPYGGPSGNDSYATRPCHRVGQDRAQWGEPEDGNCNEVSAAFRASLLVLWSSPSLSLLFLLLLLLAVSFVLL